MKKINRIVMLMILLCSANIVLANSVVDVMQSSTSNLHLQINSSDFTQQQVILSDKNTYTKIAPSLGQLLPGQPNLPQVGRWIIVPNGARISVDYSSNQILEYDEIDLAPVQMALQDRATAPKPDFVKDEKLYRQASYYPENQVKIEQRFFKNGQEYALLKVSPFQYNPQTRILKLSSHLDININFSGGSMSSSKGNIAALNQNLVSENAESRTEREAVSEMIIITDELFNEQAEMLAEWKLQLGINTEIFTTQEIGNTVDEIETFIDDYCAATEVLPGYLLLLGDAEFVPTHYKTVHPYSGGGQGHTAADLYYADFEDDLLIDMAYGRIPVDTVAEADSIITRIIRYEKNPPVESSYYENAIAAAYFQEQDAGNGMAERRFAKTSEDFRNYLQMEEGYTIERIYVTDSYTDPLYWNDNYYVFENDTPGEDLPDELKRPTFAWNGNAGDIINSVNEGKFLLMHRDHGWRLGWGDPSFNVGNVNQINNQQKTPIVWTINCETSWFDNETDDYSCGTSEDSESFTEAWMRHATGGSVGLIGATRVSYSGNNDRLVWGLIDAIWPDYLDWAQADYPENEAIYRMGDVMNYAKEYLMINYSFDDEVLLTTMEEFSYFGDPTMQIYTAEPEEIAATHPGLIPFGTEGFIVETDIEDALVTLVFNNEIVGLGYANQGEAVLGLTALESIGTAVLTISKHNHIPYVAEVLVEPEGAYISSELAAITELGDYIDQSIQSLDILNLDILIYNIGSEASAPLTLGVSTLSDNVAVLQSSAQSEIIAYGSENTVEAAFQIELLQNIPDSTMIELDILISDGEAEWGNTVSFMVHAANLKYQEYTLVGDDDVFAPGESAEIFFDIINNGSGYAYDINSTLTSENEFAIITGADNIATLAPGESAEMSQPFEITLDSEFPVDTYLELNLKMIDIAELQHEQIAYLLIGVILFDLEDDPEWLHESLTEGYGDQWHLSMQANNSLMGDHSYKFGSDDEDNYENEQHGALYMPQVNIAAGSFLRFWHKMSAGHQTSSISWDGGLLEISIDGSDFEQIFPVGGYPNSLLNLPSSPFEADTEFYSGYFAWEEAEFDLSDYEGEAVIRFVFGSANMQTSEGWYIDDLRIGSNETTDAADDQVDELQFTISNYPNPFTISKDRSAATNICFSLPKTNADLANVEIYNLKGQLVKKFEVNLESQRSERYQVFWNGDDRNGTSVGSGVYFYRVEAGKYSASRKMMLIK